MQDLQLAEERRESLKKEKEWRAEQQMRHDLAAAEHLRSLREGKKVNRILFFNYQVTFSRQ